jgi:hypothetical protein
MSVVVLTWMEAVEAVEEIQGAEAGKKIPNEILHPIIRDTKINDRKGTTYKLSCPHLSQ